MSDYRVQAGVGLGYLERPVWYYLESRPLKREGEGCASQGNSARPRPRSRVRAASYRMDPHPKKIRLISWGAMPLVSDIKLIRTDTTHDLSQKAEKGVPHYLHLTLLMPRSALPGLPSLWAKYHPNSSIAPSSLNATVAISHKNIQRIAIKLSRSTMP